MAGALDAFTILVLPGWHGSGPEHWQWQWERAFPAFRRVEQDDWDRPVYAAWLARLQAAVRQAGKPVVLVGHSLGTSLTMLFALRDGAPELVRKVAGAFLVAPTDRDVRDGIPDGPVGFAPMILQPLPFPSMLVASDDDEFVTIERARVFAQAWGSRLVEVGRRGHIGSAANLGLWPEGLVLFGEFVGGLPR
ncbi:alpha/beta hydrolase [Alsobacter soli]|uniref:Alpha/beta hydrolase n=1 Tax=Alsobacter soli TaxID=2109933 RepID=A0A2T1HNJ9_9HYPH|nr:alpha/beta hydrolase [Alsobacter soli]PSC03171.1 alpha/beta hydrolase [Alsobacter soli]